MNSPEANELHAKLERALSPEQDSILPSLGFTDSVMAAVLSQAPGPLHFPWKRALPGLIAAIVALAGFAAADLWVMTRTPAAAPASAALDWHPLLISILGHATNPTTLWTLLAFAVPVVALWLTRRLVLSR